MIEKIWGARQKMCKLVAELVEADKAIVKEMFARLESQCAAPGLDVRITGEIYGKLHMKMRELGLDPNDTTPHELYVALMNLTRLHDNFLAKRIGVSNQQDASEIAGRVAHFLTTMNFPKATWALKHTTIKRLFKAAPPKQLMKVLHYRSLDSMLKREPTAMLFTLARHIEPETWQRKVVQSYRKLQSRDFEAKEIEVCYMTAKRWHLIGQALGKAHRSNCLHNLEAGAVLLLPLEIAAMPGLTLMSLLLTLHDVNEIRSFSTYCKFNHMRPDFGQLLVKHFTTDVRDHVSLAGHAIHWRIIHRYFGTQDRIRHPEIFQPHIQPEDLAYRKAEEVLYRIEPALKFWHDLDYVGLPQPDGPLSFSLMDMATNLVNGLPLEKRASYHLRDALWNEIYCRYVGQQAFEQQVLLQLDDLTLADASPVRDMEFVW